MLSFKTNQYLEMFVPHLFHCVVKTDEFFPFHLKNAKKNTLKFSNSRKKKCDVSEK